MRETHLRFQLQASAGLPSSPPVTPDKTPDKSADKSGLNNLANLDAGENRESTMIGKTISHYKIIEKIGMGEVYKAKDQKLGKNVPIKVLPQEFARGAERVARFERETNCLLADHARAF
jgi:hypothetical protein